MNHKHVGNPKDACTGCYAELQEDIRIERRKRTAGVVLLVVWAFVVAAVAGWYLLKAGSHIG